MFYHKYNKYKQKYNNILKGGSDHTTILCNEPFEKRDIVIDSLNKDRFNILEYVTIRTGEEDATINNDAYKLISNSNKEYFLKIGNWKTPNLYKDRCLKHEKIVYEILKTRVPEYIGIHFSDYIKSGLVYCSTQVGKSKKLKSNVGFLLLDYMDLSNYRFPNQNDIEIVKTAIDFLEHLGIIHLDPTKNILINNENNQFFWLDFEAVYIQDGITYEECFPYSKTQIAKNICNNIIMPTPIIIDKKKSRTDYMEDDSGFQSLKRGSLFDDDDMDNSPAPFRMGSLFN